MSRRFPGIPDPGSSIMELQNTVRVLKQIVEDLIGQRIAGVPGTSRVWVQRVAPVNIQCETGDIWFNTDTHAVAYFNGTWTAIA